MNQLPAGLADPLHFPDPYPTWKLALLAAILLLAFAWILWRRRRRRAVPATPSAPPPPRAAGSGIAEAIEKIRRRFKHADRREGCHRLSELLRAHFEQGGEHRFSTLTVREIAAAVGETAVARLFGLLAELQFGRREPSRSDFQGICELARETAAAARRQPKR